MKQLLTILFFTLSLTASAQYRWTDKYPEPQYRVDTISGILVVVASIDELGGNIAYMVGGMDGFKIDSVYSYFGEVRCPDRRWGMYCEGWTDRILSTTYINSEYEIIEPKWIIKFVPK